MKVDFGSNENDYRKRERENESRRVKSHVINNVIFMYDYMCKITCDLLYKSHVIIYVGRVAALRRQNFDLRQNEISGPDSFSRSFFQCSFSFEPPSWLNLATKFHKNHYFTISLSIFMENNENVRLQNIYNFLIAC